MHTFRSQTGAPASECTPAFIGVHRKRQISDVDVDKSTATCHTLPSKPSGVFSKPWTVPREVIPLVCQLLLSVNLYFVNVTRWRVSRFFYFICLTCLIWTVFFFFTKIEISVLRVPSTRQYHTISFARRIICQNKKRKQQKINNRINI